MAWFYLFVAGIFEIFWAVGIKYCDGFKIWTSVKVKAICRHFC